MSAHFTRDHVYLIVTSYASIGGVLPYAKIKSYGIDGIYFNYQDGMATNAKRLEALNAGIASVGLFCPIESSANGAYSALQISQRLSQFAVNDAGQTPVLLDVEPSVGSVPFWNSFIPRWRELRPGRVTDFTPEPYKAADLPLADLLAARFDCVIQGYFGDMSRVPHEEARDDYEDRGWPKDGLHFFIDGGRKDFPLGFYQGQQARAFPKGTHIWNANLMRERGLI